MVPKPHLTHVAFPARDVAASIAFYQRYAGLFVVHDRTDAGVRVVWLSEDAVDPCFVLVLISDEDATARSATLLRHLGYDVASRAAVDEIAARGAAEGVLLQGPVDAGAIVGYLCMLSDPDGNVVEFSHGQPIHPKDLPGGI